MPVSVQITLAQQQSFELKCGADSRRVDFTEVEALAAAADREYYGRSTGLPQLTALGRRLYQWLDGPQGWLRSGLANGETVLRLDLAARLEAQELNAGTDALLRRLAHLPWELLHDGKEFLAERGVQPIRAMQSRASRGQPENRPLRLLFMAASPEDVRPLLDYEREEMAILDATRKQPIELVVEESGSVAQLQNLVDSFRKGYFDVFHVTGHAGIEGGTPQFLTEDDHGRAQGATAEQLAKAFRHRWPRLLFLSGCHTAQAPDRGTIPSMAHALVDAGAEAVLGWARPVYDVTGIFAAQQLYHALAVGKTPLEAAASTRREMLRAFLKDTNQAYCSDWHLLRLYQGVPETAALVTPLKTFKREQLKHKEPERDFLDKDGNRKVAGASSFFGRRREMQRCLRALSHPGDSYGVFLHGLGGYGKSTIAARLCRRHEALNPGCERVVLIGPVDEDKLRQRLSDRFGTMPEAGQVLNQPQMAFQHQLEAFFNLVEAAGRPVLLVLDDFEQNIPEARVEDGSLRLAKSAWHALQALCFALEASNGPSRLIVTCRYYEVMALPAHRLFVEGLSGMSGGDIDKKTRALVQGVPAAERNPRREARIVEVADGNPRLLEWLMGLPKDIVEDAFLERLGEVLGEFRESLLAGKLLEALGEPERKVLARMTLFQLPVPWEVVTELADGSSMERPKSLGLLERQITPDEDLYRVSTVLEPLLRPALGDVEWGEARRRAARKLYQVWWEIPEKRRVDRGLEVVQIAVAAGERELAVVPADEIANHWINGSRFQEAAALCRTVLAAFDDYRILGTMARAEEVLGEVAAARVHYERALAGCPVSEERKKSATLHNLAGLEAQQGDIARALDLWQQSLESYERIGDLQGKATTLHNMANVIAQQGDIARALDLWQQSLEIKERIGDVRGKAATLHQMAGVIAQQGDIPRAVDLWQQSLEINERIGDLQGKAATLHEMAGVIAQQGDIPRALELWQESLEIEERIGNVRGKAATLHQMAGVIAQQGDIPRALELWQQALEIYERIGDRQGKAATLHNMAWAAGESGDHARGDQLYRDAAKAFASTRAYLDLMTVLGNLGATAQEGRPIYAAQAAWLAATVHAPADASLGVLRQLFGLVPSGDQLEPLIGAAARILVARRGANHPQREKLNESAVKMISIAAGNAGVETQEAFEEWFTENRLADPDSVLSRLTSQLEQFIGDQWIFDRSPLK